MEVRKYPLSRSPLYKLSSKRKARELLGLDGSMLKSGQVFTYRTFAQNGKTISDPPPKLKCSQRRLLNFLSRILVPDWLMSGQKGRSYVGNARYHQGRPYIGSVDISNFYESVTSHRIFQLFHYRFLQPQDLAWLFTELVTHQGKLPRGNPASQLISFLAYQATFQRIHDFCGAVGVRMSLYVDDLVFSSDIPFPNELFTDIEGILMDAGLSLNPAKTRYNHGKHFARVTGVFLLPDGTAKIPNKLGFKVVTALRKGRTLRDPRLRGYISSARQVDPLVFPSLLKPPSPSVDIAKKWD